MVVASGTCGGTAGDLTPSRIVGFAAARSGGPKGIYWPRSKASAACSTGSEIAHRGASDLIENQRGVRGSRHYADAGSSGFDWEPRVKTLKAAGGHPRSATDRGEAGPRSSAHRLLTMLGPVPGDGRYWSREPVSRWGRLGGEWPSSERVWV